MRPEEPKLTVTEEGFTEAKCCARKPSFRAETDPDWGLCRASGLLATDLSKTASILWIVDQRVKGREWLWGYVEDGKWIKIEVGYYTGYIISFENGLFLSNIALATIHKITPISSCFSSNNLVFFIYNKSVQRKIYFSISGKIGYHFINRCNN